MRHTENADRVLETLAAQPGGRWEHTQRELSLQLGIAQPVLSQLIKKLEHSGKIVRREPLPMRGRNHVLQLAIETPQVSHEPVDREPVTPQVVISASPEEVGTAVLTTFKYLVEQEDRLRRQKEAVRKNLVELREKLQQEQQRTHRLMDEKARLLEELERTSTEKTELQAKYNQAVLRKRESALVVPIRELMTEESRHILEVLRSK